MKKKILTKN